MVKKRKISKEARIRFEVQTLRRQAQKKKQKKQLTPLQKIELTRRLRLARIRTSQAGIPKFRQFKVGFKQPSAAKQVRDIKLFRTSKVFGTNLAAPTEKDLASVENIDFLTRDGLDVEGGFMLSDDLHGSEIFVPSKVKDL